MCSSLRAAIAWNSRLSSLHSPARSSFMDVMMGRFSSWNSGSFRMLVMSSSILRVSSFLRATCKRKKYPEHMSRRTMVYLFPCLDRSLHVITSPQNVWPTRRSMYGDVLSYIRLNDPLRRLQTMHFPLWLPMCPCLMCSSRPDIFFSRDFIPAFDPSMTPSVSSNKCLFHSS